MVFFGMYVGWGGGFDFWIYLKLNLRDIGIGIGKEVNVINYSSGY